MSQIDSTEQFRKSLFTNIRFLTLLSGQGISYFGDSIAAVALPILVLHITGSGFFLGLVGFLELASLIVVGLPAGVWVDRWNRSKVMLAADFGRAILIALIPIASMAHIAIMPVIIVVAILSGILSVFFGAAYTGTISRIVPQEQLGSANGYFEAIESVAYALGPSIAGILSIKIGPALTLGLDALSFVVSGLAILSFRDHGIPPIPSSSKSNFIVEMQAGIDAVLKDPVIKAASWLWGTNRFVFAALIPTLTFYILKTLHGNSEQVGIAVSLYAVGSLVGTLLGSKIQQNMGVALSGQGLMLFGSALLSTNIWFPTVFISSALLGLGEGVLLVCYLTVRVRRMPEDIVGRVYTVTSSTTQGMGAVGYLVVGILLSNWGGHITWIVLASLCIISMIPSILMVKTS